jgi:Flp pilus assembly pilin Flp
MNKLTTLLHRLRNDERGLSTVEYVVLLVLIVAMAVAAWNSFGKDVNAKLKTASGSFNSKVTAGGTDTKTPTTDGTGD